MPQTLDQGGLDLLFRDGRSQNAWLDTPVPEATLHALYDLVKFGPTTGNTCPMRVVFVTSDAGKARLAPHLSEGNRAKTMQAPVCAILAYDMKFADRVPELFPHNPEARNWYDGTPEQVFETVLRNASLQAGYFIIAARALGLDVGPMSGFDAATLNADFFPEGQYRTNFLCCLGHGNPEGLFPRLPRLSFEAACEIV